MRRESRKGRSAVSGRRRERHGVGVRMTSAMLKRHSGISAAPTAGLRSAMSRVTSRSAHVLYGAQRRAAIHAMRHDAHARSGPISTPSISIRFTLAGWTGVPKKDSRLRPPDQNDLRRRSAIVAGLVLLCGRKIHIQFIFKMKGATVS